MGGLLATAGCAGNSRFMTYDGPQVTQVLAFKGQRQMYLMSGEQTLRQFNFQLGFAPTGHKQFEGDGRTPEGVYRINRRNPNSAFHLSIGISYPNTRDRAFAYAHGRSPGGDIFVHGTPSEVEGRPDWTAGCIAVRNSEIEEIYAMVGDGTQIIIAP